MQTALIIVVAAFAVWGFFKWKGVLKRRSAAMNIVLGKATYRALSADDQKRVHDKAVEDLNGMMGGRFKGFKGESAQFGCYAHAMAQLEIPPIVKDYCYPRWYFVQNPFFDIMPWDPMIDMVAKEVRTKHGVDVTISKENELFDRIRGKDAQNAS